ARRHRERARPRVRRRPPCRRRHDPRLAPAREPRQPARRLRGVDAGARPGRRPARGARRTRRPADRRRLRRLCRCARDASSGQRRRPQDGRPLPGRDRPARRGLRGSGGRRRRPGPGTPRRMTLRLSAADRRRPGPAPVTPHSDFEPVTSAPSLDWAAVSAGEPPTGSGRIEVSQSGRWERWADVDGDPSFPAPGARAAEGPPDDVAWRKVVVPENYGFDEELSRQFAPVWYRRTFADPRHGGLPESPGRVRLRFAAVDYLADVWLNGEHPGPPQGAVPPLRLPPPPPPP